MMAAKIVSTRTEIMPALRFIGKRCLCDPADFVAKWNEWLEKGWFDQLGKLGAAPENGDAYLGGGGGDGYGFVYWIGLLFPAGAPVPDGFEYADVPAAKYIAFEVSGKKAGELSGEEVHLLCTDEMRKRDLTQLNKGWGFERYRSLGQAVPGENNFAFFEWLTSIE